MIIDRFTDTAAILISIVTIYYYGMFRGQIHINLPPGHPIMFFETIEIKMAAVSAKRSIVVIMMNANDNDNDNDSHNDDDNDSNSSERHPERHRGGNYL